MSQGRFADLTTSTGEPLRLFYIDVPSARESDSSSGPTNNGTILLIHGFPQTSHQYRHVSHPLSAAGYRLIIPDYRGAGLSPPPLPSASYTKTALASDLHQLIHSHLGIKEPIYIIGHDLGGMIAHAYAYLYSSSVKAVIWGECPLPGTSVYDNSMSNPAQFHFQFHTQIDLASHLVHGNERFYLQHFFNKISHSAAPGISEQDLDHYTNMYSLPGRMRAAMALYAAFPKDKEENLKWLEENRGKCRVPVMGLNGEYSHHRTDSEPMLREMYAGETTVAHVPNAGHYIAEENPEGFVEKVLGYLRKG